MVTWCVDVDLLGITADHVMGFTAAIMLVAILALVIMLNTPIHFPEDEQEREDP